MGATEWGDTAVPGVPMLDEVLRGHRRRLGLTQEELAERAGVSVRTICHLETGRIERPRPATVRQLADALALSGAGREEFRRTADGLPPRPRVSTPPVPDTAPDERVIVGRTAALATPSQLPAPFPGFSGRTAQLAELDVLLDDSRDQWRTGSGTGPGSGPGAVVISAVAGTAGVGKTALAVHWASRVAARFPDGQLYVNLRGFHATGEVMTPAEAVRRFLDAFEVPAERVPAAPEAQFDMYRSLCAGRRVLVLLDNARDAEQVRPLLPGAPGCLALVTSRNQLTGLVAADGARPLRLDLLTEPEARQLLARRLGPARLAAEPAAVADIIDRCARLPLALSIVAARAAADPQFGLAEFARELNRSDAGLDPFTDDDPATDVRAVFSWSYHRLSPGAARLFRLLGLHPGPDITAPAAAGLTGLSPEQVRPHLGELTRAHLLNQHAPGRYTLHDLLRAYATELTGEHDPEHDRRTALRRLLDHYLHSAATASDALSWYRDPIPLTEPDATVVPEQLTVPARASAWFAAELPNLTAAVGRASRSGFESHAWQLAWTMTAFFDLAGHWQEWVSTHRQALDAARRSGDTVGETRTLRNLARVRSRQGRHQDALVLLRHSESLARDLDDPVAQAQALRNMSTVLGRRHRHTDALDLAQRALSLFETAGHRIGQGRVLNQIGWHLSMVGDHRQAVHYCRQSLDIVRDLVDRDGEGAAWNSLGSAHQHLGDHREAITCLGRALRLRRERGDLGEIAETLDHLAEAQLSLGDRARATECWHEALELLEQLGHGGAERIRARLDAAEAPGTPSEGASEGASAPFAETTPPDVFHG
ncbi:tetratricopeptide repeat protein [Streptomyces brasiliscabiei]|uniref:Tetratricopeptide repeat protein n=1 Tax=Streptomyces brasiliscabiei TaxID=2736302 RepID=A0ABU8G3P8_9ACTN